LGLVLQGHNVYPSCPFNVTLRICRENKRI